MIVLMGDGSSSGTQVQTPECKDGDTRCEGDLVKECVNGKWEETMACENGQECENRCGCTNGEYRCDGNKFQICKEQIWETQIECAAGECVGSLENDRLLACKCNEDIQCTGDDKEMGKVCVYSEEDFYVNGQHLPYQYGSDKPCDGDEICSGGMCVASNGCNTPMPQDDKKWKCEDNTWVLDNSCDVNVDESKCVDGKYEKCVNGKWQAEDCNGNRQCKDNKCIECDDEIGCGQGYLCENNVCLKVDCNFGDAPECADEIIQNCQDRKWVNGEDCSMKGEGCEDGRCVTCHNGQTRCNPDNKSMFQLCKNNKWHDVVSCGDNNCDGTRIGTNQYKACECEVGNTKPGNGNNDNCYFECNGGIKEYGGIEYKNYWVGLACNDGFTCVGGVCIKDGCSENSYKCDGNSLMKCNRGMWSLVQSCGMGKTCNSEARHCDECTTGSYMCVSEDTGNRKYCRDGQWTDNNCTGNDICSELDGGACIKKNLSCEKDKTICKSRTEIMDCIQGRWNVSDDCNGIEEVCGQKGKDAACVNMIKVSGGGYWGCDDIFKDYLRCDQKGNFDGRVIRICNAYNKWDDYEKCKSGVCGYRNKELMCVDKVNCEEYSYTCNSDKTKVMFCINNKLEDFANCKGVGLTCVKDSNGQAHCGK